MGHGARLEATPQKSFAGFGGTFSRGTEAPMDFENTSDLTVDEHKPWLMAVTMQQKQQQQKQQQMQQMQFASPIRGAAALNQTQAGELFSSTGGTWVSPNAASVFRFGASNTASTKTSASSAPASASALSPTPAAKIESDKPSVAPLDGHDQQDHEATPSRSRKRKKVLASSRHSDNGYSSDDLALKMMLAIPKITHQVAECTKAYYTNRCMPGERVPAVEAFCKEWEICMGRDPKKWGVGAETLAEILNKLVEPLSYKTMIFGTLTLFGTLMLTSSALSFLRARPSPSAHGTLVAGTNTSGLALGMDSSMGTHLGTPPFVPATIHHHHHPPALSPYESPLSSRQALRYGSSRSAASPSRSPFAGHPGEHRGLARRLAGEPHTSHRRHGSSSGRRRLDDLGSDSE
ncbi:Di-sulfide bridge nucleocytoplasmic transport domain-containing protein [Entophlyctis helioformis]|nr:Di-sulfide bridge nucleocytoplasmic transport domain-containing protein [Entophlyctis helioformis]